MSTPHPTCPICADQLADFDYLNAGYVDTVWVCERCDVRLSPEAVAELAELADAEG